MDTNTHDTKERALPTLMTVEEAANALGILPHTLRAWLRQGRVEGVKLGLKSWRIAAAELRRIAAEGIQ